jgi:hypothetical protein
MMFKHLMTRLFPAIALVLGAWLCLLAPVSAATHSTDVATAYMLADAGLDKAVRRVADQTGGRVLKAYRKGSVYVIKVLMPSGVVKTFTVSANGG